MDDIIGKRGQRYVCDMFFPVSVHYVRHNLNLDDAAIIPYHARSFTSVDGLDGYATSQSLIGLRDGHAWTPSELCAALPILSHSLSVAMTARCLRVLLMVESASQERAWRNTRALPMV